MCFTASPSPGNGPHSGDAMQEKVLYTERTSLMVFEQSESGTEGHEDREDSGLSSWDHAVSREVLECLRGSSVPHKEGTVWGLVAKRHGSPSSLVGLLGRKRA